MLKKIGDDASNIIALIRVSIRLALHKIPLDIYTITCAISLFRDNWPLNTKRVFWKLGGFDRSRRTFNSSSGLLEG